MSDTFPYPVGTVVISKLLDNATLRVLETTEHYSVYQPNYSPFKEEDFQIPHKDFEAIFWLIDEEATRLSQIELQTKAEVTEWLKEET
jgi:hypothetical protein